MHSVYSPLMSSETVFNFTGTCQRNWLWLHGICKAEVWTVLFKEACFIGFFRNHPWCSFDWW
jgi:hypothetical protein